MAACACGIVVDIFRAGEIHPGDVSCDRLRMTARSMQTVVDSHAVKFCCK